MNEWTRSHVLVGILGYCVIASALFVYLIYKTNQIRRDEQAGDSETD